MVVWIRGDGLHKEAKQWAAEHVRRLEGRYGITPKLAVLLLNDDPVELETQKRYVSLKAKDVKEVGGEVEVYELYREPPEIREAAALRLIERLNNADDVTGGSHPEAPPALYQRDQAIRASKPHEGRRRPHPGEQETPRGGLRPQQRRTALHARRHSGAV
jgi:hypothetical protein